MHFHWSYLDETLAKGEAYGPRGTSVYLVRLKDGWRGEDVAAAIDAKFAGGPQRTRTRHGGRVPGLVDRHARQPARRSSA